MWLRLLDLSKKNRVLNYTSGIRLKRQIQIMDTTLDDEISLTDRDFLQGSANMSVGRSARSAKRAIRLKPFHHGLYRSVGGPGLQ